MVKSIMKSGSILVHKLVLMIVVLPLIAISCSRNLPNKASSTTFTAGNETELREGAARVNEFREELPSSGFRIVSTANSNLWEQVTLKGDYGELKDVEVVLQIGKQLEMKEPHLSASLRAYVAGKAAEQEFARLDARLKTAIQGK